MGQVLGKSDFTFLQTTQERVVYANGPVLAKASGYEAKDGSLRPQKVTKAHIDVTGTIVPIEQSPATFLVDGDQGFGIVDGAGQLYSSVDGTPFAAASPEGVVGDFDGMDCVPVRAGAQVIFCTKDGMVAYEPGSPAGSTNIRPLSLKAPTDYKQNAKPDINSQSWPGTRLMIAENDDWTKIDKNSVVMTIDETAGSIALVNTFADDIVHDVAAGDILATYTSPSVVSLLGKAWLWLDMMIDGDDQDYDSVGMFPNNPAMTPSGYCIRLFDDTAAELSCSPIHIPKLESKGKVYRILVNIGENTSDVKAVKFCAESFWKQQTIFDSTTIKLYGQEYSADWKMQGNFLLPPPTWEDSTISESLKLAIADSIPQSTDKRNLITNGSLQNASAEGWTLSQAMFSLATGNPVACGGDYPPGVVGTVGRSAGGAIHLENWTHRMESIHDHTHVHCAHADSVGVIGGAIYEIGVWAHIDSRYPRASIYVRCDFGAATNPFVYFPGNRSFATEKEATWATRETIWREEWSDIGWKHFTYQVQAPLDAAACTLGIYNYVTSSAVFIDDVSFALSNIIQAQTTVILCKMNQDGSEADPGLPGVIYSYAFAGKELLGDYYPKLIVSNLSTETVEAVADPWLAPMLSIALPAAKAPIASADVRLGGWPYAPDDILTVLGNEAVDNVYVPATVKVLTVTANDAIETIELVDAGDGYYSAVDAGTTVVDPDANQINSVLSIVTDGATVITDYGDYVTHVLVYRQMKDGPTGIWTDWEIVGLVPIAPIMEFTDNLADKPLLLFDREIPQYAELSNDFASVARFACMHDKRIYALTCAWDENESKWKAPTQIEISSWDKHYAFPTTTDEDSPITDGTVLDNYATNGSEGRGIVSNGTDVIVLLDNECFAIRGSSSITGWGLTRLDSIGCVSSRTIANCRGLVIWHDGQEFYGTQGAGAPQRLSWNRVNSKLIDFTEPHNAVYANGRYILFCNYDGHQAAITLEIATQAWNVRESDTLDSLIGICSDGLNVYGVTADGHLVDLFGDDHEYDDTGGTATVREIWTQFHVISDPGTDKRVNAGVFEIEATEACEIDVEWEGQGSRVEEQAFTIQVTPEQIRYIQNLNIGCTAIQTRITVTGESAPVFHFIGVDIDPAGLR